MEKLSTTEGEGEKTVIEATSAKEIVALSSHRKDPIMPKAERPSLPCHFTWTFFGNICVAKFCNHY